MLSNPPPLKWLFLGALALLAGCGKAASEPTVVAGKVSYRGQALAAGTIVFTPDPARGAAGPPVGADIQPDGLYRMPPKDMPPLAAGWYRVTVAAVQMQPAAPGQPYAQARSLLPAHYRDPDRSGLICEIKPGIANGINFNLE